MRTSAINVRYFVVLALVPNHEALTLETIEVQLPIPEPCSFDHGTKGQPAVVDTANDRPGGGVIRA